MKLTYHDIMSALFGGFMIVSVIHAFNNGGAVFLIYAIVCAVWSAKHEVLAEIKRSKGE